MEEAITCSVRSSSRCASESNASGIVPDERGDEVAARLSEERLFSGWGVRTMAAGDGGYNPIGYHQGTVWPHDNSLIAAGLRRYGHHEEAATIAFAILEAAQYFLGRLPEYPTACSPQAWATAAPLLLLRVLLGLEGRDGRVEVDPVLPEPIAKLALRGLPGPDGRYDAATGVAAAA